jgi:ParB/RepB/Spo0J family partition protein
MKSFKQMVQTGEIKRADAMKVQLDNIHEEPGFNLREEGPDLEASIDALAEYIHAGGIVPPLEVRPREEGGVWVVDGHRRRRAYVKARDRGAPIEWIDVRAFVGNDADRVARIMTSAEGRALSPLEVARGYKRMAALGLTPDEIAAKVHKTRQHVDQMMILATAPTAVHKMVAAGDVSAAVAVKVAREHGDNAGQVLQQELDKAHKQGKGKVTEGTMKQSLPQRIVREVVDAADYVVSELKPAQLEHLLAIKAGAAERRGATIEVPASALLDLIEAQDKVKDAREKAAVRAAKRAAKAAQQELSV